MEDHAPTGLVARLDRDADDGPVGPNRSRDWRVIRSAREEARRLRHRHVGVEHILLGIIRDNPTMYPLPTHVHGGLEAARRVVALLRVPGTSAYEGPLLLSMRSREFIVHAERTIGLLEGQSREQIILIRMLELHEPVVVEVFRVQGIDVEELSVEARLAA